MAGHAPIGNRAMRSQAREQRAVSIDRDELWNVAADTATIGAVKSTSTALIVAALLVLGIAIGAAATHLGSRATHATPGPTSVSPRSAPVSSRVAPVASPPPKSRAAVDPAKVAACRQDALSDRDSDNLKAAIADDGCAGVLSDETIRRIAEGGN